MEQHLQILINREWIAPWADCLLAFLSNYGAWAPWLLGFLLIGVVFGNFKLRAALLTAGLAVGLCDGIGVNLLKNTVERPRPSQSEPGVRYVEMGAAPRHWPKIVGLLSEPIIRFPNGTEAPENHGGFIAHPEPGEHLTGHSFPSGHAANNMAVATVLIFFYPRRGWLYLPIALLIGYARIYTGSHWPLDVLAGFIMGIGGGWLAVQIVEFLWWRFGSRFFPKQAAENRILTKMVICSKRSA